MNAEMQRPPATYAAMVFSGEALDPQMVTAIVGVNPTLDYKFGSDYVYKGVQKTRKTGIWIFSTRNMIESDSLKKHLDVIEELLIGSRSAWPNVRLGKIRELIVAQKLRLRVDIFWYGAEAATFPKISRSFDQVVAMAGGTVETDFHRVGDSVDAA